MLRRSVAVIGPSASAASTSSLRAVALASSGCRPCTPSSSQTAQSASASSAVLSQPRYFTSSTICSRSSRADGFMPRSYEGDSTSGYAPRRSRNNDEHSSNFRNDHGARGGKGAKHNRFAKARFQPRKQAPKADFSLPEPPTAQHVGRRLVEKLTTMSRDPELPSQLVAYGIKGIPAQSLIRHFTARGDPRHTDSGESLQVAALDRANAIQLFRLWSEEAKDVILDLALLHDAGRSEGSVDVETFAYLSDAVSSFSVEGEQCLGRFCISAFLDWIDRGLEHLSSPEHPQSDLKFTAAQMAQIGLARSQISLLRSCMDLRKPVYQHTQARILTRNIHLHVGPTNSGKTHGALVALSKAKTGIFAGPLRLLAHEVWDRFNSGTVSPGVAARACNLVTGEEKRTVDPLAGLTSCTVEMVSTMSAVDVAVIDEIQMIGDPQRGYAWTNAVLGLPAKELHLCGEASVIPLIQNLAQACGDHLTVHNYERLTPLSVADESLNNDLANIQKGDCIVAFSRTAIFALKREIEKKTGLRCAVAYGALPPETKSEQAKLFNEGKLDVMVASDAIGMGLNLRIKRVIFDTLTKWNGKEEIVLSASQIKQIAGRAGRYGTQDKDTKKADLGGIVTTRHEHELEILQAALASPLLPITRGAIQPSSDTLSRLSAMLPAKDNGSGGGGMRTLAQIFADVSLLARIDSTNFFLADFSQQLAISPLIESASSGLLTVSERETFSNAPANTRDERVVAFLGKAVAQFSRGGLVKFDEAAKDLAMLEVEDEVVSLMHQAIAAKNRTKRSKPPTTTTGATGEAEAEGEGERAGREELPLIAYLSKTKTSGLVEGSAAHPLINVTTLLMLESLHRCLTLYLWLSFRFPLAFCYRTQMEARKKQAEDVIDFVLQGIRFGRAKRLQALGRSSSSTPRRQL